MKRGVTQLYPTAIFVFWITVIGVTLFSSNKDGSDALSFYSSLPAGNCTFLSFFKISWKILDR